MLIDETIQNLVYLVDWLLEDIDVGALQSDLLAKDAAKAISTLRAIHALLPRLRIVRSNFESTPTLPDAVRPPPHQALADYIERERVLLQKLLDRQGVSIPLFQPGPNKPPKEYQRWL